MRDYDYLSVLSMYEQVNSVAEKGGIVFFGANYLSELPVSELFSDFDIRVPVHNRSLPGLSVNDAEGVMDICILQLAPRKVFLNLGDADMDRPGFRAGEFIGAYRRFLFALKRSCGAEIYILSVVSAPPAAAGIGRQLRDLAEEMGCRYVDVAPAAGCDRPGVKMADMIRPFVRLQPISFADAMGYVPSPRQKA